jgi:hypothetical protein
MASNRIAVSRNRLSLDSALRQPISGQATSWLSMGIGPWLYVLATLCLVSLLAFAHLGQASYVANQVEEMETREQDLQILKQGNNALRLEIAHFEQMDRIVREAQSQGLGKPEHIEYVEAPVSELESPEGEGPMELGRSLSAVALGPLPVWLDGALGQFTDWVQTARLQPEP